MAEEEAIAVVGEMKDVAETIDAVEEATEEAKARVVVIVGTEENETEVREVEAEKK